MSIAGIGTKFKGIFLAKKDAEKEAKIEKRIQKAKIGKDTGIFFAKVGKFIATRSENVIKVARVIIPFLEIIETVAKKKGWESIVLKLAPLKGRLKTVKDVGNATSIFERGQDWADPSKRSDNFKTWQKATSKILLTGSGIIQAVDFVDKLHFNYFSQFSFSLGSIPTLGTIGELMFPLEIIKNAFISVGSIMSIWDSSKSLCKVNEEWKTAKKKKREWIKRQRDFKAKKPIDVTIDAWRKKYTQNQNKKKLEQWKNYVEIINGRNDYSEANRKISVLNEDISKYESDILDATVRLKYTASKNVKKTLQKKITFIQDKIVKKSKELDVAKVALAKLKEFSQMTKALRDKRADLIIKHKIQKHDIRLENRTNDKRKSWVSIASEIAKLFIIILTTTCAFIGISKILIPSLLIGSFSGLSETIGFAKIIYAEFAPKPKPELGRFFYAS